MKERMIQRIVNELSDKFLYSVAGEQITKIMGQVRNDSRCQDYENQCPFEKSKI